MARVPKPSGGKITFGKPRDLSESRKPIGSRYYRKQILIIVEGTETEKLYFTALKKDFRIPTLKILVMDSGAKTDPSQIIEKAIKRKNELQNKREWEDQLDEVWCVFDTENPNNRGGMINVYSIADTERIELAVSNPSFEYWYLLHFEKTDREFLDAKAVISRLRLFLPQYEKSKDVYVNLRHNLEIALSNAEILRKRNKGVWDTKGNPSTGVDLLVDKIKRIKEEHNV